MALVCSAPAGPPQLGVQRKARASGMVLPDVAELP